MNTAKTKVLLALAAIILPYHSANSEISRRSSLVTNIKKLPRGLYIPSRDSLEEINISFAKIKSRVMRYRADKRVEPVKIKLRGNSLMLVSEKLARRGHTVYLYQEIKKSLPANYQGKEIIVTPDILKYIDPARLTRLFSAQHRRVIAFPSKLSDQQKAKLLGQTRYFFNSDQQQRLKRKVFNNSFLTVDRDLLPEFAARMVRRYTIFRGPNCFHAVLAFQDPDFPKSVFLNVKEELGYHRLMINHDELWRALDENFYEVRPTVSELKFGDIIVFFKIPEDSSVAFPSFRWLKHTAVYLFNNYTFSKGSKSSNSPYTVKTLQDEWQTWRKILKRPAIKIFRRSSHKLNKKFTASLQDWLY